MIQRCAFIVNPHAGKGRCGKEWSASIEPLVAKTFKEHVVKFSLCPLHVIELVGECIDEGWHLIVAVGGDGTVNEAVNGYMKFHGKEKGISIGLISMGTGGDFVRTVGIPTDIEQALEVIRQGYRMEVDLGLIRWTGAGSKNAEEGERKDENEEPKPFLERYFLNIVGAGVGGDVCESVKKSSNRFGGKISYLCTSVTSTLKFVNRPVQYRINDAKEWKDATVFNFMVANGRYQGGGMMMAPDAELNNGCFDVVVLGDMRLFGSLVPFISKVYSGGHIGMKDVTVYHDVKKVEVRPRESGGDEQQLPTRIEVDGESLNELPMVCTVAPSAISLILPAQFVSDHKKGNNNGGGDDGIDPLENPENRHDTWRQGKK